MKKTIKFLMNEHPMEWLILGFLALFIFLAVLVVSFDLKPSPYRGSCEATWKEGGITYTRHYSYCPSDIKDKNELRP